MLDQSKEKLKETKLEEIREAIESLKTRVDTCDEWSVPMTSKRIGMIVHGALIHGIIDSNQASAYHDETNKLIKRFSEECKCSHK